MVDREKTALGIREMLMRDTWRDIDANRPRYQHILNDALALLKEQEDLGTELTNAVELIHKKNERIEKLLKEQEAVEPDVDSEGTCSCGNCGENVGYYPVGSKVPEKLCKYCPECGKAVKWE